MTHLRQTEPFRWEGVPLRPYRDEAAHVSGISRQVLAEPGDVPAELRYFEIEPDGHSSLERHEHAHLVVVVRGSGRCLVGDDVHELATGDVVSVPPLAWHQFRTRDEGEPLGFLCLVRAELGEAERPGEAALAELRRDPRVAGFIRP